ncbi:hypothetical protein BN3662_01712 [Clostridiales bacterium CHKCI006]|nr:hypothetical protein BN3662_01712 [Clostridiales bacterium CHKCI006]
MKISVFILFGPLAYFLESDHISWQHNGSKKSDSPNYLDNENNTNTLGKIP